MNPWNAPIVVHEELDSTNRLALQLAADGAAHGTVVVAEHQTAGRGRQGRAWAAAEGALTLSVVVRRSRDGLLPLRAGLAVARVAGPSARVKWPNDVLIDGRKVAGILVEAGDGDAAVIGIGLNVAVDPAALPPEVAVRAGSLHRDPSELPAVRARLLAELHATLGAAPELLVASLAARDALAGLPITWSGTADGAPSLEGTAEGIDDTGRLRVRDAAGELHLLDGGEVHLL